MAKKVDLLAYKTVVADRPSTVKDYVRYANLAGELLDEKFGPVRGPRQARGSNVECELEYGTLVFCVLHGSSILLVLFWLFKSCFMD